MYEPKIILISVSVAAMLVMLGFVAGMIATFRIVHFSIQAAYEIKHGEAGFKNKRVSPEIEMLDEDNKNEKNS